MEQTWSLEQRASFLTSVLSTAGGLAFAGDLDRSLKAVEVTCSRCRAIDRVRYGSSPSRRAPVHRVTPSGDSAEV